MVADRDAERNAELVARLVPLGDVAGHVADVSTADFAEPLAAATLAAFGGIDVVVNNAAIYRRARGASTRSRSGTGHSTQPPLALPR